jgi:succinoglycan biosynthesis protein ExoM
VIPHITVCICTFKRPELLQKLLGAIQNQETSGKFGFSIVVVDNDSEESARPIVSEISKNGNMEIVYCTERLQNIAIVRNKALAHARGEFVALIDDDELPVPNWLESLMITCEQYGVDGVLGPVRPSFETSPPEWVTKGRFCDRPEYQTGRQMSWNECRSGNVLFRRSLVQKAAEPFDPRFAMGGEDKDFFRRTERAGAKFVWCNEAFAYESVPASRLTRSYMLKRALLRGRNVLKYDDSWRFVAMSLIAVPAYLLMLPFTLFGGECLFMKYCIKLCDHSGRLLASLHLNPVTVRDP